MLMMVHGALKDESEQEMTLCLQESLERKTDVTKTSNEGNCKR